MPEDGLEQLKSFDAILFGSAGSLEVPDHITLWGLRLEIYQHFDQYANVRPSRLLPGIKSPLKNIGPAELDWVIVRENTEGEYSGAGGRVHPKLPQEVGIDVSVFTRDGIERVMRYAFELALTRPKKQLTLVTKSNAQRHGMVLWDEVFEKLKHDYPGITTDRMLVDAITTRMVFQPQSLDTIVATNLHADILSDLAAALSGSLGIGPTANINPERIFPSMFEPIHGSAFDLVGKDLANPLGAFWSCVMMLEHLQEKKGASLLMSAIEEVCQEGRHLPIDLGGNSCTGKVTTAVCAALKK